MFNDINLSNALALIDKPVWVITEVRGRNKNNRTYSKSRSKNVIYPATITNVQVWRGYSHSKGDTGCPKCTVTVDIATKDDTGTEIYFDLVLTESFVKVRNLFSRKNVEAGIFYLTVDILMKPILDVIRLTPAADFFGIAHKALFYTLNSVFLVDVLSGNFDAFVRSFVRNFSTVGAHHADV